MLEKHHFEEWSRMMAAEYKDEVQPTAPVTFIDRAFVERFIEDSQALINETFWRYEHE